MQVRTPCRFLGNFREYFCHIPRNTCYSCYMALNLRTIDKPLHEGLKIWALSSGKSLDEFCVELLRKSLLANTVVLSREPDVEATYEAFSELAKLVDQPKVWTAAGKCAHGYMNSFVCEREVGGCGR